MHVVINAQLDPEQAGGIAQVIAGLAHGLGRLCEHDAFTFVCSPRSAEWLRSYDTGATRIVVNEKTTPGPRRGLRISDGFWESFNPDVLHFPYQACTRTDVPTVFNPHDLLHVHFPEFFSDEERERRESMLGEACQQAAVVAVASGWVRQDVTRHYSLDADKVRVIAWGAPSALSSAPIPSEVDEVLRSFQLARGFAFFPAQTWPHKNHARLLEAITLLRDELGVRVPLVCTGTLTDHADSLQRRTHELRLDGQTRWLGRVGDRPLTALYRAARLVVVPSLFEAASFPVMEAFDQGVPVACSRVTSLPEQAGDAALLFDPEDARDIARAILTLWRNEPLRQSMIDRGRRRAAQYSWDATARAYVDLYQVALKRRHGTATQQTVPWRNPNDKFVSESPIGAPT